jgi:hypothetical protein
MRVSAVRSRWAANSKTPRFFSREVYEALRSPALRSMRWLRVSEKSYP